MSTISCEGTNSNRLQLLFFLVKRNWYSVRCLSSKITAPVHLAGEYGENVNGCSFFLCSCTRMMLIHCKMDKTHSLENYSVLMEKKMD